MAKVCSKCNKKKRLTSFYKRKERKAPYNYHALCKVCWAKRASAYGKTAQAKRVNQKAWVKWYKKNQPAMLTRREDYYLANTVDILKRQKKKRDKNPAIYAEKAKAHYWANRDRIRLRGKELYQLNREKLLKRSKEWREKHPEASRNYYNTVAGAVSRKQSKYRRRVQMRIGIVLAVDPVFTADLKILLARALEYGKCPLCDKRIKSVKGFHLEHAIPIGGGRGGTHCKGNVYFCCATCNMRKHTKTLEEFAGISFKDLPVTL